MSPILKRFSFAAVLLVAGCAMDPAVKPWWTLTEANFRQLQPGKTTQAEARIVLGNPINAVTFARLGEQVWDYRYPDLSIVMLAWVYFDARGVYKYYTAQPDPAFIYAEGS